VLPYGDLTDRLLIRYLNSAPGNIRDDEPIFRSISKRNYGEPITVHTWTKDVEKLRDTAMLPKFHPHTMRHLALTDLARSGWDILDIKEFAGHASLRSTEKYIHLSSRDLKKRYAATMNQLHSQRLQIMSLMFSANA
jgi:integrase/recombinase XerD